MTSTSCPSCSEPVQQLQGNAAKAMPYCPACGWNVVQAQGVVAHQRRVMVVALLFFAAMNAMLLPSRPSFRDALEIYFSLMALFGIMFAVGWRKSSRDSRALAEVARSGSAGYIRKRTIPKPNAGILAQFDEVRLQACPRRVRLNQEARVARNLVRIFPIGVWLWGIHDLLLPNRPIGLAERTPVEARIGGTILLGLGTLLWFLVARSLENKRQLNLLRNGQVALARVTGPFSGSATSSGIMCKFTDANGHVVQGKGAATRSRFNQDDYVLVFYDPRNSQECTALCATNYEFAKR